MCASWLKDLIEPGPHRQSVNGIKHQGITRADYGGTTQAHTIPDMGLRKQGFSFGWPWCFPQTHVHHQYTPPAL